MKQLIEIDVEYLKEGDLIFDFKHRNLQEVISVQLEDKYGTDLRYRTSIYPVENIIIHYGEKSNVSDNLKVGNKVLILIDTEELKIIKPENIR